jgi:GNAT superfamily N-acetyltransferase
LALPGAAEIERASLKAWPGLEVEYDGAWVRRAANGYTKRANSVQSLDPADDGDAEARLAASVRWFGERHLPPVFRVTPLAGPRLVAALDAGGWPTLDHSRLMAMDLGPTAPDRRGEVLAAGDPAFLEAQRRLQGYDATAAAGLAAVLGVLTVPAAGIVLHAADGTAVAAALMSLADGIVLTGNVVTAAGERRKGHAAAMMRTGLAWAYAQGARVAALNVLADNAPAIALYERLGYAAQYDYGYRRSPVP